MEDNLFTDNGEQLKDMPIVRVRQFTKPERLTKAVNEYLKTNKLTAKQKEIFTYLCNYENRTFSPKRLAYLFGRKLGPTILTCEQLKDRGLIQKKKETGFYGVIGGIQLFKERKLYD